MICPACSAPVEIPRKAFLGPGETPTECPNGHKLVATFRVKTETTPEPRA